MLHRKYTAYHIKSQNNSYYQCIENMMSLFLECFIIGGCYEDIKCLRLDKHNTCCHPDTIHRRNMERVI